MERVDCSDRATAETYLIQGTESPILFTTQPLEQVETMNSDDAPKFILDQSLYYPSPNYYGYYCTGLESPSVWDDHHRFFGFDGQDLHCAGLQIENLPYVYYTPNYGLAQSPYNPYNPYIPGAFVVDGSYVGTQPYYSGYPYQHPISSPTYYPLLQPSPDGIPSSSLEPRSLNAGTSIITGPNKPGFKGNNTSLGSVGTTKAPSRPAAGDVKAEAGKRSEGSKSNATLFKHRTAVQTVASDTAIHSALPHNTQAQSTSSSIRVADQLSPGVSSSIPNPVKVATSVNGLSDFQLNAREWGGGDKLKPRWHYGGILKNGNGLPDLLGEQNRGPRTNRSKNQCASILVEAYGTKAGLSIAQGNIIIRADNYNREDFSVNFADAKFFVIKSYSEDDVHKSIKYNVWSSTPTGNKRLQNAYEDAQRTSAGKQKECPIFLFFSVNASGQFCGVAEMIGPVDFNKNMNFWQQDKWSGSFPVKWHIIKDVPNANFRHIIIENNENKPVTNSRDTQEIKYKPGLEMLNIFKNYTLKTSLLDDFMYYEERQKIMQEENKRLLGKTYDSSYFVSAFVPPTQPNDMVDQRPILSDTPKLKGHHDNSNKMMISPNEDTPLKPEVTHTSGAMDKCENVAGGGNDVPSVLKVDTLSIDPKHNEAKSSEATGAVQGTDESVDVVTAGSMHVKVNGFAKSSSSSSGTITIGTIPIFPKALSN